MKRFVQIVRVAGKAVQIVTCEVSNHGTQTHDPRRCSEHKIIGPNTTRQSYECPMRSFETAQPDTRLMSIILAVTTIILSNDRTDGKT